MPVRDERGGSWIPWAAGALVLLGLCLVIAVPNLIEARKHGAEAPWIGALKTINTAQTLFREGDKDRDGTLDYGTLAELADAGLIDEVLGAGEKQGYRFEVCPSPTTPEFLWCAVANPVEPGAGDRHGCTNQAGVIYYTYARARPLTLDDAGADCSIPAGMLPVGK